MMKLSGMEGVLVNDIDIRFQSKSTEREGPCEI